MEMTKRRFASTTFRFRLESLFHPVAEILVGRLECVVVEPDSLLDLAHLADEFLVIRVGGKATGIFPKLLDVVLHLLAEVFHDFLLIIEADIDAVHRPEVFFKILFQLLLAARVLDGELAEDVVVLLVELLELVTEFRQAFHVALAGLDLLVENDAVEAFLTLVEFFGELEVVLGDESELVKVFRNFDFSILDAFGNFRLPARG